MRLIDADALNFDGLGICEIVESIDDAPTVDAVKRGEWNGWTTSAFIGIDEENEPRFADRKFYRCGDCRYGSVVKTNFCPNCGADMRTEDEHA